MKPLIANPLANEAEEMLVWLYGESAGRAMRRRGTEGQRIGQAFMNTLMNFDPISWHRLNGSLFDPFYQDKKIPAALDFMTRK